MWFTLLAPLISGIFGENGPLGQYFKTKALQVQASADLAMKVEQNKLEMSRDLAQAAVESEKNKLNATGQGFKFVTFCMLSLPILITCVFPEFGKRIFDNLALVPVGWFQLWALVIGVIWGLPIAANAMTTVLTSLQEVWNQRNEGKIAKIQALGEASGMNLEQAKAQIFDIMKQTVNLNGYTQAQVDGINKVLDPLLQKIGGRNNG
jgi:hypothetical protein